MKSQQKADDDLLKVYGKMMAILVLLIVFAILGARYMSTIPNLTKQGLAFEHNRLLNVLAMVRSQWLTSGRPDKMLLSWYNVAPNVLDDTSAVETSKSSQLENSTLHRAQDKAEAELMGANNWITLSSNGWPVLDTDDVNGCKKLWQQLLASKVEELDLTIEYQAETKVCRYYSDDKASLSYQLQTGRVIFLTGET
ncbi:hypothetical protein [Shewanella sp. MEBiC00475]|uniref:hypothetical protein n=1 Tax=Shewanella sp. MEBiC00475 TaxID=2575361 RepID=UPI0010C03BF8|nr:hypothetical protein [Shewanella sp. MEBiC00475]